MQECAWPRQNVEQMQAAPSLTHYVFEAEYRQQGAGGSLLNMRPAHEKLSQ
jgi:hypothetical protein